MSQNIKSNGFAPHQSKDPGKTVTVTLGRPSEHPFAASWPEGGEIIERDGGVYVRVPGAGRTNAEGKAIKGVDFTEVRVDSRDDAAHLARGDAPWYAARLAAQKK